MIFIITSLLSACQKSNSGFRIEEIANPSALNSGEAFLIESPDDKLYLTWLEEIDTAKTRMKLSVLKNTEFEMNQNIKEGDDWFINWADFPGIGFIGDSNPIPLVYWLKMSAPGIYDYDVNYSITLDQGESWSPPKILHNDGIPAEHGFVSSCTVDDQLLLIWLDGRQTKTNQDYDPQNQHDHGHGQGDAMTLRSAMIDQEGNISQRLEIDDKVCDCCQTDVVNTACGPIAVYRDRSDEEVRDIYYSKLKNGQWSKAQAVHQDGWKITGCPVNGPRIASSENLVAVAWYTESGGFRKTLLSTSKDCGRSFSKPVILSFDSIAMGRIDIKVNEKQEIFVSYMEESQEEASIWLAKCNSDGDIIHREVIATNGKSRKSGFPRMAIHNDHIYIAYRDILQSDKIKVLKIS